MIDFRYHLVSIVSIFMALAVGIVLGAGPLKEDIGNTLTSEVKNLRADKAALRGELDAAEKGTKARDEFTTASNRTWLSGSSHTDRNVRSSRTPAPSGPWATTGASSWSLTVASPWLPLLPESA